MPVIATATSASLFASTPAAIAQAVASDTSPKVSRISLLTQLCREGCRMWATCAAVGRLELDARGEIIVGILLAQRAGEDDRADRLLLRPAARPGKAGDRDRDVGIAVREHARRHRPGGCERYFAEGFEDFAADIELRLFGVPGISAETRGKYVRTAGDVGQRGAHHPAGAAFGDGDPAARGAVIREHGGGKIVARGKARFFDRQQDQFSGSCRVAAACAAIPSRRPVKPSRSLVVAFTLTRSTRSEEHTSELQSLMRLSYAVFCLKKKK